jgi:holo-[acyl-carrier protein] synthase
MLPWTIPAGQLKMLGMYGQSAPVGVGVDIVEMKRAKGIRLQRRFAEYFLTPSELAAWEGNSDKVAFIASRFAAKEAVIKAYPGFLRPHDFEIIKKGKKPMVRFLVSASCLRYRALVSLAHSTDYAVGYAIIFEK